MLFLPCVLSTSHTIPMAPSRGWGRGDRGASLSTFRNGLAGVNYAAAGGRLLALGTVPILLLPGQTPGGSGRLS